MSEADIELVRGSGNVFRDLNIAMGDLEQLKAVLAARIISVLDERALSVRRAHELTGFAAADFSRIRQAKLDRFTIDRLLTMLKRLDTSLEITMTFGRRDDASQDFPSAA